jgi:glycosyltransferase involved in cell wall biosynthesis
LRLAVVSPFVDRRHGTERSLAELLERLARDYGCEIHLYSQRVADLTLGATRFASVDGLDSKKRGSIMWHKVPSVPGPHLVQFLFWLLMNLCGRLWDRWARGLRVDLVLSPGINCFGADAVMVHALFHRLRDLAQEQANSREMSGLFRRLHRRLYYSLLTPMEGRIYGSRKVSLAATSRRTAALLSQYFRRDDVRVILHGVNAAEFSLVNRFALRSEARARYKLEEKDFVALLIGNDWRNKGLSTVLNAMAAASDFPFHLLIAGQDATSPFHQAAATALGVSDRCRWETASVNALQLYAAADAYVSPTREDSFGLPLLEAMACGLPVITSVFAGASQIITDGVDGFVLKDPNDAATLASHLKNLQEHSDLRLRMGENARRTSEAYTWERNAAAVWQFLNEVVSKKGLSSQ